MKLHTLKRSKGIVSKSKRIGRGNGSGKGNYSTKGLKGQKARSGTTTRPFFEWGQTSIVQRIPKARGFKRYFKLVKEVSIINLGDINNDKRIIDGSEITKVMLEDLGYIKNANEFVKVLWNGELTKKITFVDVDAYSKSAQEMIANPSAKKAKAEPKAEDIEAAKPAKKAAPKKTAEKVEDSEEKKAPAKKAAPKKTAEKAEKKPTAKKTSTKKETK